MNKIFSIVIFLFVISITGGCGEGNRSEGNANNYPMTEVLIQRESFNPPVINISRGTKVKWINKRRTIQSVTSRSPEKISFDSGNIDPGEEFIFEFHKTGEFEYYSKHDPDNRGKVIVK